MTLLREEAFRIPDVLFHVTSKKVAPSIQRFGVLAHAPWVTAEMAAHHANLLGQAGHPPMVLPLPRQALEALGPVPDWNTLHHPPLELIERSVEDLAVQWAKSEADWKASLEVLGSFCLSQNVPASILRQHIPRLDHWAEEARKAKASHRKKRRNKPRRT